MNTPEKQPTNLGRPRFAAGEARVTLTMQRVTTSTLERLRVLAPEHGGIGRVIDAAVLRLGQAEKTDDI